MKKRYVPCVVAFLTLCSILFTSCRRQTPSSVVVTSGSKTLEEFRELLNNPVEFPFSFRYDGERNKGFGDGFTEEGRETANEEGKEKTTLRFRHTASGALFTVEACAYEAYSAYEWTVTIQNAGERDTGVFSDIYAADITFVGNDPCVKGISGDTGDMYAPYEVTLLPDQPYRVESTSGRPDARHDVCRFRGDRSDVDRRAGTNQCACTDFRLWRNAGPYKDQHRK